MVEQKPTDDSKLTGLILAGGLSTRFGSDKASAPLEGRPLLQWVVSALGQVCSEIVIVRAAGQVLPALENAQSVRVVDDVFEARGPLAGMVAGFEAVGAGLCAVASCDAPLLEPALLTGMAKGVGEHDAVCGRVGGRLQPLVGVYRVEQCLLVFRRRVEEGRLAVRDALEDLDVRVLDEDELRRWDPDLRSYRGANTPAELADLAVMARESRDRRFGAG
jgi:molybdopterin-guanine dinucleotide biosynthesis protein A